MPPALQTVAVIFPNSEYALALVRKHFATVHYFPDEAVPADIAATVDVWFTRWTGLPKDIKFEELGATRIVQLTSAGANIALQHPVFALPEARRQITVCSASGIHVLAIPPYIVGMLVNAYFNIGTSVVITRTEKRWPRRAELAYRGEPTSTPSDSPLMFGRGGFKTLRGKTAGLLGYGHIGRETARLLKAMGVRIVAANSAGVKKADDGYIIPETGDPDGSLPDAYYSTTDPASFEQFLRQSDLLIASLPSTPATTYMLTAEHFKMLPQDAVFVNVGRGNLVKSDILLAALDDSLLAVALDVTDPEPLPEGHALLSHPRALITPHISADIEGYFDRGAELLVANVQRIRDGGEPMNVVDPERGY